MNSANQRPPAAEPARRGFTLIELLVVIGVIGILAALVIGGAPALVIKSRRANVQAQLAALTKAIEDYKQDKGFYPPGHGNQGNAFTNQLYYELTGTTRNDSNPGEVVFTTRAGRTITTSVIQDYFGGAAKVDGFVNAGADPKEVKNYYPTLKPNQVRELPGSPGVEMLVVPYKGPSGEFNPWQYTPVPLNNPDNAYDVWVEITLGSKSVKMGNWKD